jgi:hypothetical protein
MMKGSETIVLSIEEGKKLLGVIHEDWTIKRLKHLQKIGALEIVDELRLIVRDSEEDHEG